MQAPTGERWVHEIKHDGFRIIARRIDRNVRLFTKQAADYSRRYPLVVEAINRFRVPSIVLADEDKGRFETMLAKIAKAKPRA